MIRTKIKVSQRIEAQRAESTQDDDDEDEEEKDAAGRQRRAVSMWQQFDCEFENQCDRCRIDRKAASVQSKLSGGHRWWVAGSGLWADECPGDLTPEEADAGAAE